MSVQNNDFAARLERIAAGGVHTRNTLFVGVDETYVLPIRNGRMQRPRPSLIEGLKSPIVMVSALFMGITLMILVRMIHFHSFSNAPVLGSTFNAVALDAILAVLLCILSGRVVFRDHAATLRGWQVLGVILCALGMHNLVHLLPGAFGVLFSENWVRTVLISTEMRTLILGYLEIPF
jgi:hypothetical protein